MRHWKQCLEVPLPSFPRSPSSRVGSSQLFATRFPYYFGAWNWQIFSQITWPFYSSHLWFTSWKDLITVVQPGLSSRRFTIVSFGKITTERRGRQSVYMPGKDDRPITRFNFVVVTETSYRMLEFLSVCDQWKARTPSIMAGKHILNLHISFTNRQRWNLLGVLDWREFMANTSMIYLVMVGCCFGHRHRSSSQW